MGAFLARDLANLLSLSRELPTRDLHVNKPFFYIFYHEILISDYFYGE